MDDCNLQIKSLQVSAKENDRVRYRTDQIRQMPGVHIVRGKRWKWICEKGTKNEMFRMQEPIWLTNNEMLAECLEGLPEGLTREMSAYSGIAWMNSRDPPEMVEAVLKGTSLNSSES